MAQSLRQEQSGAYHIRTRPRTSTDDEMKGPAGSIQKHLSQGLFTAIATAACHYLRELYAKRCAALHANLPTALPIHSIKLCTQLCPRHCSLTALSFARSFAHGIAHSQH